MCGARQSTPFGLHSASPEAYSKYNNNAQRRATIYIVRRRGMPSIKKKLARSSPSNSNSDMMRDRGGTTSTFRWLIVVVLFITSLDHLMGCVSFIHPCCSSARPFLSLSSLTNNNNNGNNIVVDPTFLFNADIDRVASAVTYNSAQRAEDMLKQMQDLHRSGSRTVRPNKQTFTIVIRAHGKVIQWLKNNTTNNNRKNKQLSSSVVVNAATRAMELHQELWGLYHATVSETTDEKDLLTLRPDAVSSTAVLQVLAHTSGCPGDWCDSGCDLPTNSSSCFAEQAEQILMEMIRLSAQDVNFTPDVTSYEAVLLAWCNSKHPNAAQRAAHILQLMIMESKISTTVFPTTNCFNKVLEAYAKSRNLEMATTLLSRMENDGMQPRGDDDWNTKNDTTLVLVRYPSPNVESYVPLILQLCRQTHQKRNNTTSKFISEDIQQATSLLKKAVKIYKEQSLDRQEDAELVKLCFNVVINAWASIPPTTSARRTNNIAPMMAEQLLDELEQLHVAGYKASPDTVTFNSVMKAFSKAQHSKGASQHCLQLLSRMENNSSGSQCKPDVYSYSTCIDAIVKSDEEGAAETAENLLQQLEARFLEGETKIINKYMFSAVMNAYSNNNSEQFNAVEKVENLLERMKVLYNWSGEESVQPDVVCYTSLVKVYAQSKVAGSAQKAVDMLEEMESLYDNDGNRMIKPNVRTYTAVIQAISTSRDQRGKAKLTDHIVNRMIQRYEEGKLNELPNIYTYNYMLNACANIMEDSPEEQFEAFSLAVAVFKKILHDTRLPQDSFTFAFFLKACANLLPPSAQREQLALHAFQRCCRDGHVSTEVISRLKQICSEDVLQIALQNTNVGANTKQMMTKPPKRQHKKT